MPHARTRACRRRRRLEDGLREAVRRARLADSKAVAWAVRQEEPPAGHGELWRLFCDIERSGLRLRDVAQAVNFDKDEQVMLDQAVALYLAMPIPGSVARYHRPAK